LPRSSACACARRRPSGSRSWQRSLATNLRCCKTSRRARRSRSKRSPVPSSSSAASRERQPRASTRFTRAPGCSTRRWRAGRWALPRRGMQAGREDALRLALAKLEDGEAHGQDLADACPPRGVLGDEHELLRIGDAGGNDHAAAGFELEEKVWRHKLGCGRHHDLVERAMFGQAVMSVAALELDVLIAEALEARARRLEELFDDLDAVYPGRELREYRGLVAEPRADFEHLVAWLDLEEIGHECHDEGLGDRLAVADREWRIRIGVFTQLRWHEIVPRHAAEGVEHRPVEPVLADLLAGELRVSQDFLDHHGSKGRELHIAHSAPSRDARLSSPFGVKSRAWKKPN